MRIETDKQQVYKNIMQLTALTARNRKNMEIAVTEDNLPAMGIYMAEGLTEAENELRRHLKSSSEFSLYDTATNIVLETKDILRAAESTTGQIKSSMILYLTHYAISRWVSDIETAKDLAEPYGNSAGGYLSKLQALVCQRDEYEVPENEYEARQSDTSETNNDGSNGLLADAELREADGSETNNDGSNGLLTDAEARETDGSETNNDGSNGLLADAEARQSDTTAIGIDNTNGFMAEAETRQRDLQPIRRIWPDGVVTDIDTNILQDSEKNIMVTKTLNYEDRHYTKEKGDTQ